MLIQFLTSGIGLSEIIDDKGQVIPPDGLDMSDKATLENFLLWSFENYPAEHYLLDLWDHGSGIFASEKPPIPFRNVCGGLTLWEIRDACETALASQDLVDKIDIIGFDVCILGWIETAYCLRNVADIIIASENGEPGPGWDYGPPFINLRDNIETQTAEQLAWDIVEYYIISYTDPSHPYHYPADNCTQAASSTDALMSIAVPALNDFCELAMGYLPTWKDQLEECRQATGYWGGQVSDIGHFAIEVSNHSDLPQDLKDSASLVADAVEESMIHHVHNDGVPEEESGWKIWFPANIEDSPSNFLTEYLDSGYLEFYETQWDDFLYEFAGAMQVKEGWLVIEDVQFSDETGGDGDGILEPDENIEVTMTIRNTGDDIAQNINGEIFQMPAYEAMFEIITDTATFPDTPVDETSQNTTPFVIHILPDAPSCGQAEFRTNLYCDGSESKNLPVIFPINPAEILVLDLDPDNTSAAAIASAIETNGYTVEIASVDINEVNFDTYLAAFITLGMYSSAGSNYYPDDDDFATLEVYLQNGGKVYLESGDLWAYLSGFISPDFCPLFGITGISDGGLDITEFEGETGTVLEDMQFDYPGDDSYMDEIDATVDCPGAELWMSSVEPEFGCMVAMDDGTCRTVGTSFEFGGLEDGEEPNTKTELMARILEFMGL